MAITVCPNCGAELDDRDGKVAILRCPVCGRRLRKPKPEGGSKT